MRKRRSKVSRETEADPALLNERTADDRLAQSLASSTIEGKSTGDQQIVGELDAIVGRTVEGWAMNAKLPEIPATVEIFDGDQLLGSAVAFIFRADLLSAGMGAGNHHFKFLLPESVFDGNLHIISVRPAGLKENLRNSPISVEHGGENVAVEPPPKAHPIEIAAGMLEVVSEEGWVKGWAWYPNMPDNRVEIEVLVDGEVVGHTVAAFHRPDLVVAGIGDGNYSFAHALPYEVLARPRGSVVSVRAKGTDRVLPEPRLFQRREVTNAIEKLSELENDARLLNSTLNLTANQAAAEKRAAADLFRTVGDFFVQLAAATEAGRPAGSLKSLRGAIEDVTARFPAIEFNNSSNPHLSICVEATDSLEKIYNTLCAIRRFKSNIHIEVVLFDTGACDEAPLLPLVVRNLRYIYVGAGHSPISVRNRVADYAQGHIMVFLAGFAVPSADWVEMIYTAFEGDQSLAVIGAKILRGDGVLANAGVILTNNRSAIVGLGADPSSEEFTHRKHIDAVTGEAFAVRRDTWQRTCGTSESQAVLEIALADVCKRITASGGRVVYEPQFEVVLQE